MTNNNSTNIAMRIAVADDTALILQFIRELAEYEHLSDTVFITKETILDWISSRQIEVLIAEYEGKPAGFALYYFNYSTFRGQKGIYLEDLFVRPEFRRHGIGTQFFHKIAQIAKSRSCFRLDWMVLDWNANSISFYEKLGGRRVPNWIMYRLQGDELNALALSDTKEQRECIDL
ncbi:MAG: GNAT family N-acetyltransferase [Planctomycetaceae bacterium]|jgi:GNAT superfamily N-acetyltransferase|nr:GNAT family N-acetyltransferase [Planctomycetaceae bacterium]